MRRELRARLLFLAEAIEAGDYGLALDIARDLLDELGGVVRPSSSCPECGLEMWPGELPAHRSNVHHVAEAA